jgi:lipoprotein-anchoring transpeptidase ErfK/SrfK
MLLFSSAGTDDASGAACTLSDDAREAFEKLRALVGSDTQPSIVVEVATQRLYLMGEDGFVSAYPVSTSKYGTGNRDGSNKTPLGAHRIKKKYGEGAPLGTIFRAREKTGKVAEIRTDETDSQEDLITTRILWLEGLEPGINKGRGIDSYRRYIYIHGTPEEGLIGKPASHGCVRMKNTDVVELFEKVPAGTLVEIK